MAILELQQALSAIAEKLNEPKTKEVLLVEPVADHKGNPGLITIHIKSPDDLKAIQDSLKPTNSTT